MRVHSARWGRILAWMALAVGLAATAALWVQSERAVQARMDAVLEQRLALARARLGEAFSTYSTILLAARSWLASGQQGGEAGWQAFVATLDLRRRAPGMRHLLYADPPIPGQGTGIPAAVSWRYGGPEFLAAPGGADFARAVAPALRAADLAQGSASLSPGFRLTASGEPVVMLMLRVHRSDVPRPSGYAAALIDVDALMRHLVDAALADVVLRVYEGVEPAERQLLYRAPVEGDLRRVRSGVVRVEDRLWTVEVSPGAGLDGAIAKNTSNAILAAGSAVSLLLFVSLLALASGHARASLLAQRMGEAARARSRRFSELARHAPMGVFVADPSGRYLFVNDRWRGLFELSEEAASGEGWAGAVHPHDRQRVLAAWREAVRARTPFQQDCRLVADQAGERWVSISAVPERGEDASLVAWIGTCMDITARRRAEAELSRANEALEQRVLARTRDLERANASLSREIEERRRAERERGEILQRQAALLRSIPDMAWLKDRDLRFLAVNERVTALLGVPEEQIVGRSDADFMPPEVARRNREEDVQVLRTGRAMRVDDMGRYATKRWYEVVKSPVLDENGEVIGVAGVARDISERKRTEEALRASNARLHALADELRLRARARAAMNELGSVLAGCSALAAGQAALARQIGALFPEGAGRLFWLDEAGALARSTAQWGGAVGSADTLEPERCHALLQGRPHHRVPGRAAPSCAHLLNGPDAASVCAPLRVGGRIAGLLYWEGPDEPTGSDAALAAERDSAWRQWACAVAEYIGLALSNLALRQSLLIQARHDPLTDLYNRRYMEEALEREVRRAERSGRPMGVIMADVDHFKRYNDTLGHEAGDRLLVALADCLRAQVRAGDIVCRYGGEEFLIILPEASLELLTQRAEELRALVARQMGDLAVAGMQPVTMSLGVACFPVHARDASELVCAADEALYCAKHAGRDRVEIADPDRRGKRPQRLSRSASSSSR